MSNAISETKLYPLMPLRDIVIFPHMVAPLVVGRKQSIQALEDAMEKRTEIFLVTQINAGEDEPGPAGIHRVGTLASVMQLLRLPDGTIKALVEGGLNRATDVLKSQEDKLHLLAQALLEYETLSGEEIDQLMKDGKIDRPDKPSGPVIAQPLPGSAVPKAGKKFGGEGGAAPQGA